MCVGLTGPGWLCDAPAPFGSGRTRADGPQSPLVASLLPLAVRGCQQEPKSAPGSGSEKCTTWGLVERFRRRAVGPEPEPLGAAPVPRSREAVALALERDHVGVVDEAVDEGGGDHGVAEDLAPGLEAAVGGDDDRAAFVAARDQREEQVGGLAFEWQVADLVDDEQARSARGGGVRRRGRCGVGRLRGGRPIAGRSRTRRGGRPGRP